MKRALLVLALALFAIAAPLRAEDNDRVSFFNDIHVGQDDAVSDVVCFFCSVDMRGSSGDIVVFFGDIHSDGRSGDNVLFGGTVQLGDNASPHDVVVMGGRLLASPNTTIRGDRVVFPFAFLLVPLLTVALIVWGFVWLLRAIFGNRRRVVYVPVQPR